MSATSPSENLSAHTEGQRTLTAGQQRAAHQPVGIHVLSYGLYLLRRRRRAAASQGGAQAELTQRCTPDRSADGSREKGRSCPEQAAACSPAEARLDVALGGVHDEHRLHERRRGGPAHASHGESELDRYPGATRTPLRQPCARAHRLASGHMNFGSCGTKSSRGAGFCTGSVSLSRTWTFAYGLASPLDARATSSNSEPGASESASESASFWIGISLEKGLSGNKLFTTPVERCRTLPPRRRATLDTDFMADKGKTVSGTARCAYSN
jgi:hypothetical protein